MTKLGTTSPGPELLVELDRNGDGALRTQLEGGLRAAARSGRLRAGTRLPATRVLVGGREVSSDNDSEAVCFADRTLERAWQTEMLGCMRHRPIAVTLRRPAW